MDRPLRRSALRWMAWATLGRIGGDGLFLVGRLVLARLLWPEAFGTFTLAAAVVAGAQLCCQLQLNAALVQRADLTPGLEATAFWSLAASGVAGSAVIVATAGPIGALAGDPAVASVLRAIGPVVALSGLALVPRTRLWRDLAFRPLAGVGVVAEVAASATAIAAAMRGAGVFALAVHAVVAEAVELIALWILVPWRPSRHWRYPELAELFRFGWPLAGRRALDYLVAYGDRVLIGYAFGPAALGLYALALRLVRGVALGISGIFERVGFPVFARTQDDLERSRRGFLDALRVQTALTFPVVIGVALVAPELVPLALGGAWVGAVGLMQISAIRVAAGSLGALPRAALAGRGRQWLVLWLSVGGTVAFGLGWLLGLPWGPAGVAVGGAAAALAMAPLSLWMVHREMPVGFVACLRALTPALAGVAGMAVAIEAAARLMDGGPPASRAARAAILVGVGAVSYLALLGPWVVRERRRYVGLPPGSGVAMRDSL